MNLSQSLERQRDLAAAHLTQAQLDFERAQVESQQLVNKAYELVVGQFDGPAWATGGIT